MDRSLKSRRSAASTRRPRKAQAGTQHQSLRSTFLIGRRASPSSMTWTGTRPRHARWRSVLMISRSARCGAASAVQVRLLEWVAPWPQRPGRWKSGRLGHLLAQQLVAARERVLDVQAKLAARVRLLADRAVRVVTADDTAWCCGCGRGGTMTWAGTRPGSRAGCMRRCASGPRRHRQGDHHRRRRPRAGAGRPVRRGAAGPGGAGRRPAGGPAPGQRAATGDQAEAGRGHPGPLPAARAAPTPAETAKGKTPRRRCAP